MYRGWGIDGGNGWALASRLYGLVCTVGIGGVGESGSEGVRVWVTIRPPALPVYLFLRTKSQICQTTCLSDKKLFKQIKNAIKKTTGHLIATNFV